uniref:SH3 domain-containing protein n=1 Tax=Mesocestoides corti TaxID=53468 RepID=A0A5K3ES77_MESCO
MNINEYESSGLFPENASQQRTHAFAPRQESFVEDVNAGRQHPTAIAKTAYNAKCQEELDLAPGDLLYLVHKIDENSYFAETVTTKKRGLVHTNLIELQANHPVEPEPTGSGFGSTSSLSSSSSPQSASLCTSKSDEIFADPPPLIGKTATLGGIRRCLLQDTLLNELQQKLSTNTCGSPPQSPSQDEPRQLPVKLSTNEVEPDSKEANEDTKVSAPPQPSPETKVSRRKTLWLAVDNIPEDANTDSLEFKKGDVLRWIDYDPKYLKPNSGPLPPDEFLECETWAGSPVVVPSGFVRLLTSRLELTEALGRRPRAEVIANFSASHNSELSVSVGEVIYLLTDCSATEFLAMNKSGTRGKVPKNVLNVLVAPK